MAKTMIVMALSTKVASVPMVKLVPVEAIQASAKPVRKLAQAGNGVPLAQEQPLVVVKSVMAKTMIVME